MSAGLVVTDEEKRSLLIESKKIHIKSNFNFLKSHGGLRPGNIHLLLGSSGAGKSTMTRTLLIDILEWKKTQSTVMVFLSEESAKDFKTEFFKSGFNKPVIGDVAIYSEVDDPDAYRKAFLAIPNFDYFIYDNITTSKHYMDKKSSVQGEFVVELKNNIKRAGTTALIMAHTGAEITDHSPRLININDIRGSKNIINLVEFIYIMQRFQVNNAYYSTVRIEKHRGQNLNEKLFILTYIMERYIFEKDCALEFEKFKEIFKMRNKL